MRSMSGGSDFEQRVRTSYYHCSANSPRRATESDEVHIHGVNNALKIEWDLYVQDLWTLSILRIDTICVTPTFDPTSRARAVATLALAPKSSCVYR